MSASLILEELSHETHPPSVSSPRRLFEALAQYRLSPSRSLPNELLSHIFFLASHDYENHYDAVVTPVRISHVCSHWRQVALLTGTLWTNFTLAFPVSRPQLSKTITWLIRSQKYPIDILFDFRDPSWDWEEESHTFRWQDMEAILRLFLPHVQRWRRFELLTDTWAPIFTFLWYTRKVESAPILESLSLSRCNAYFASKQESFHPIKLKEPIPLFGGLPLEKLREVSLTGVHVEWSSFKPCDLTSLNFKYQASDVMPTLDEFVAILSTCPNLEQLSIIGWGPQFPAAPSDEDSPGRNSNDHLVTQSIHLPCLRRFLFGFVDTNYAIKLISLFRLPAIEEITFDDVAGGLHPFDHVDATPFLTWILDNHDEVHSAAAGNEVPEVFSLAGVEALHLHSIHADEDIWQRLFFTLCGLRFLALHGASISSLLALSSSRPQLSTTLRVPCPLLERLDCHGLDPEVLTNVIIARSALESITSLETTLFIPECDITFEQQTRLADSGVKIVTPIEIL